MQFDNLQIKPQPRGGHTTVALGERLICFGGADRTPSPAGDIWTLQPGIDTWGSSFTLQTYISLKNTDLLETIASFIMISSV